MVCCIQVATYHSLPQSSIDTVESFYLDEYQLKYNT